MSVQSDVEWLLARLGACTEDFGVARRAGLRQLDPLRRGRVRRRLLRALTDASLSTEHAALEGHVNRCAFLAARRAGPLADDVDAVQTAFELELQRAPARTPARWQATATLAAALALALGAVLLAVLAPAHWWDSTKLPISPDAFSTGGHPDPGDDAVQSLFSRELPAFVIALDAYAPALGGERHVADQALRQAAEAALARAHSALGEQAAASLRAVLDQSRALRESRDFSGVDAYLRSVDAFNAELERSRLGYYLDAEVGLSAQGPRLFLSSFGVERVRWFRAGDARVRVLHLTRRDPLNFVHGYLGFTRPHIRDALVLLERVDAWLIDTLLPALAPEGVYVFALGAVRGRLPDGLERLSLRMGQEVRRELRALAPTCTTFDETGALFARRRTVFQDITERVVRKGGAIQVPSTYDIQVNRFASIEVLAGPALFRELERMSWALGDSDHRACFRALAQVLIASIERHEVQHRLDFASGVLARLPLELERRVGALERYGMRNVAAERALAETSAYLSELARGRELVKLNLGFLAQHVIAPQAWGTPEYFAGIVIVEGLARELGLGAQDAPGRNAPQRVADLVGLMLALEDAELSRAARRLWESLLGQPLASITE